MSEPLWQVSAPWEAYGWAHPVHQAVSQTHAFQPLLVGRRTCKAQWDALGNQELIFLVTMCAPGPMEKTAFQLNSSRPAVLAAFKESLTSLRHG